MFECQKICECGGNPECEKCNPLTGQEKMGIELQIMEDTCALHGIFCCEICFDMERYLWDRIPERK